MAPRGADANWWNKWVKVAAPRIGITKFSSGTDRGIAINTPAAQIVRPCFPRRRFASVRPTRRIAASVKYSRPSKKPFTLQKIRGASQKTFSAFLVSTAQRRSYLLMVIFFSWQPHW